MENLTPEQEKALGEAFEQAKQHSREMKKDSISQEQDFDAKEHDVFMNFDYNKNPDAVPPENEAQIRFIMQVVQSQGTHALSQAKKDLTKDSETWISFFENYPLLFNFQSRNSKTYKEDNFTLSGSIAEATSFVKAFLGYSCPTGIALNLIGVIQSASGPVLKTITTEKHVQYLALCRGYDKASTLTIYRAQLNMKVSDVKAICVETRNITLDIAYDEVTFEINNALALGLYPALSKQAVDIAAEHIGKFFLEFAEQEYRDFERFLRDL